MPLPAYLICSEGLSIDQESNKATFFNVAERFSLTRKDRVRELTAAGQPLPTISPIRIVSVWMREDTDHPDSEFEHELAVHLQGQEVLIAQATFSFKTMFHRIITPNVFFPGFPGPGVMKIEARVRKMSGSEWIRQFFYSELFLSDLEVKLASSEK